MIKIDARKQTGIKAINEVVQKACAEKIERDRKKGIRNRPVRAMVCGIPNVGKSTFINSYARKAAAKTGNKPGVTKGKQWIRLGSSLELLDTPGILWPKFEDQTVGLKLALIGSIRDEIMNIEELALELIGYLKKHYPLELASAYKIEEEIVEMENVRILERVAETRGCLIKGGEYDWLKAANIVLENFRNGKIGRISLEEPENNNEKEGHAEG